MGLRKSFEALLGVDNTIERDTPFERDGYEVTDWRIVEEAENPDGNGTELDFTLDIPSNYKMAKLILIPSWSTSVSGGELGVQFNGDTSNIYTTTYLDADGTISQNDDISEFRAGDFSSDVAPSAIVTWNIDNDPRAAPVVNASSSSNSREALSWGWNDQSRPRTDTTVRFFFTGTDTSASMEYYALLVR